jgi:hypothetical protein
MRGNPGLWLGVALLVSVCAGAGVAQPTKDHPALGGVWKMAQPRVSLRLETEAPIPFTPQGREQYQRNKAAAVRGDYEFDPTMSRCSSPGAPRIMLSDRPFKIFVRADVISMMFEWNRLLRQVNMNASPSERAWGTVMGDAWGRWEGDTLVIDSRNFKPERLLDDLIPSSDQLRLVEHLRLVNANTMEDRITITDPEMFTRSWDAVVTYQRQPKQTFVEDVCLDRKAAGQAPWPRLPSAPGAKNDMVRAAP